jgi:hypothetical protein
MASKPTKNLGKLLGFGVDELFKGDGAILEAEFRMFWAGANNKKQCSDFLKKVLAQLQSAITSPSSVSIPVHSLLNTICFITLFMEFQPTLARKFLAAWKRPTGDSSSNTNMVVSMLSHAIEKEDRIGPAIRRLTSLDPLEIDAMQNIVAHPTMSDSAIQEGHLSFYYMYVRRAVQEDAKSVTVAYSQLLGSLMGVNKQIQFFEVACHTLQTCLFLVRRLVVLTSKHRPYLDRLHKQLPELYMWPQPFGSQAYETKQLLLKELHAPGWALLQAFRQDSHMPEVNQFDDRYGQRARAVFYFMEDVKDHTAETAQFREVLGLTELGTGNEKQILRRAYRPSLSPCSAALLLASVLGAEMPLNDTDIATIRNLDEHKLSDFVNKLEDKLKHIIDQPSISAAQAMLPATLGAIKLDMQAAASDTDQGFAPRLKAGLVAPLPPTAHLSYSIDVTDYKSVTRTQLPIMGISTMPYPDSEAFVEKLQHMLEYYKDADASDRITVPFVIAGSDKLLHSVVSNVFSLKQRMPSILEGVDLKFYVVPFEKNRVASFLARRDLWYNRNIFVPFRTKMFVLPWVKPSHQTMHDEKSADASPLCQYYRDVVQSYVREANHSLPIRVYTCSGWNAPLADDGKDAEKPDEIVPFLERFELGWRAEVRRVQLVKGESARMSISEVVKRHGIEHNPPELKVSFDTVDMNGDAIATMDDAPISYNVIEASNIPRKVKERKEKSDVGLQMPPDPAEPWIELSAQASDSNRAKNSRRQNILAQEISQHVTTFTVSCSSKREQFSVLLDGQVFGPYHTVKIQAAVDTDGQPLVFPVQTFMPIQS